MLVAGRFRPSAKGRELFFSGAAEATIAVKRLSFQRVGSLLRFMAMTFFKTPGANTGVLGGSPLDLVFKVVAIFEGWWLDSHIIVNAS